MIHAERGAEVDWPPFALDLIVNFLTGILVSAVQCSAVLWWWTAVTQRRNAQEITVRDWAILKAKLS